MRKGGDAVRTRVTVGLFVFIWLVAGLAYGDTIGLYADNIGTNCNIAESPTLTYVYVVHVSSGGATASEFMAPKPACWTGATWIQDIEVYGMPGNSQTGKSIGYGACLIGTIHILTIVYFSQGLAEPCCVYPVLAVPWSPGGQLLVADCDFNAVPAIGLTATVNGNATCPCGCPVPVEETTWGAVKALYE
jgi:hypothetical protein